MEPDVDEGIISSSASDFATSEGSTNVVVDMRMLIEIEASESGTSVFGTSIKVFGEGFTVVLDPTVVVGIVVRMTAFSVCFVEKSLLPF